MRSPLSKEKPLNTVILCGSPNSQYARDVLRALNTRGLSRIHVLAADSSGARKRVGAKVTTYGWRLPWVTLRWGGNRLRQLGRSVLSRKQQDSPSFATEVGAQGGQFVCVRDINSEECRTALQTLEVDLLILAGAPIVRAHILQVPRLGTLNAHQGALPRFRGMNVIEWAILEGYPPTISIHFVDPGVDTGDIITTESVPLLPGDTLSDVRRRASIQQIDMLAHTVWRALNGPLPRCSQRSEEGRQYFVMHPVLRAITEQRLQRRLSELSSQHNIHAWEDQSAIHTARETTNAFLADRTR
jgi:folate-dependent phosphoribosylglycinamide formyltransferase PurN